MGNTSTTDGKINHRENRRDNQEWTIQRNWQHNAQGKDEQHNKQTIRKTKTMSNTDPKNHTHKNKTQTKLKQWVTPPQLSFWIGPKVGPSLEKWPKSVMWLNYKQNKCLKAYIWSLKSRVALHIFSSKLKLHLLLDSMYWMNFYVVLDSMISF